MSRTPLVLAGVAALAAALAGCSSAVPPASAAPAPAAPAAAAPAATTGPDTATACTGLVAMDAVVVTYPGGDPGAPPPTADALKQWAAQLTQPFGLVAANVPAELQPAVTTLQTSLDGLQKGTPLPADDPTTDDALGQLDKWAHDTCGFTRLDVTGNGTDLAGVPATAAAGPATVSFANGGDPAGGFVLLVAKVKDGADYTLDGIRDGSVDFTSVADVAAAVEPGPGGATGYGSVELAKGKYLLVSPIGSPPAFTGTVATELEVR
jgi:hypothetical protein